MTIRKNKDYTGFIGLITEVTATDQQIREVYGPGVRILETGTKVKIVGWKISNKNYKANLHLRLEAVNSKAAIWYPYNFVNLPEDDQE